MCPSDVRNQRVIDAAKVQRAKEMRREQTKAEETLWQALRGSQLHGLHFRRQHIPYGFIVDFYCKAAGLIIEVDGLIHDDQAEYDAARDAVLQGGGLRVLRVSNQMVEDNLPAVLTKILEAAGK